MAFSVNADRRRSATNALMRDLARFESLAGPPASALDGVVKAVADALLDATAPTAERVWLAEHDTTAKD